MSKKVKRSGVIPYIIEDKTIKMMFMKPSEAKYGGDVYQIAKGKQEDDETPLEAGLREANEELGLFEGNIEETYDLGTFLGRTSIYITKIKEKDMFGDPCEETENVAWLTLDEFEEIGRDLHKPVVKAAVRLIEQKRKHLNEIVVNYSIKEHGVDLNALDMNNGEIFFNIGEYPVYRYPEKRGGESTALVLKINDEIAAVVSYSKMTVHGYKYNYLDRAFTIPKFRGNGYAIRMVLELHRRDHTKILSDQQMSADGMKMWLKLMSELPISAYDFVNNTKHKLEDIPKDSIFVRDMPNNKYLLIIESPNIITQALTESDNFNGMVKPLGLIKIEEDKLLKNI
jgi:8-oxo-dGTP pyrophosphatase MutT (NUDIX family)